MHDHHACLHVTNAHHRRTHACTQATHELHSQHAHKPSVLRAHATHARILCTPGMQATLVMHNVAYVKCMYGVRNVHGVGAWRACGVCMSGLQACVLSVSGMCVSTLSLTSTLFDLWMHDARHSDNVFHMFHVPVANRILSSHFYEIENLKKYVVNFCTPFRTIVLPVQTETFFIGKIGDLLIFAPSIFKFQAILVYAGRQQSIGLATVWRTAGNSAQSIG